MKSVPSVLIRAALSCAIVVLVSTVISLPAAADIDTAPGSGDGAAPDPAAQLTVRGAGTGKDVRGYLGPPTFDPRGGYPSTTYAPMDNGFTPSGSMFAGTLRAMTPRHESFELYCVDIRNGTSDGLTYRTARWSDAHVLNIGLVGRIIGEYFPKTAEPAAVPDDAQRAAAVQSAVWFFSDRFVLHRDSPLYPVVAAIVTRAIAEGPVREPATPTLTITGPTAGMAGKAIGPFSVKSDKPATLSASGGQLFGDAAGTRPIANGTELPAGTRFFLRADQPATVRLQVKGLGVAVAGLNALYAPVKPRKSLAAQKLVLARDVTVPATGELAVVLQNGGGDNGGLPITGLDIAGMAAVGLALVTLGVTLVRIGRRRRRRFVA